MSNISRRDFLKTAGVMTLAVAAAGVLAGCDGKTPEVPEVTATSVTANNYTLTLKSVKQISTITNSVGADGKPAVAEDDRYVVALLNLNIVDPSKAGTTDEPFTLISAPENTGDVVKVANSGKDTLDTTQIAKLFGVDAVEDMDYTAQSGKLSVTTASLDTSKGINYVLAYKVKETSFANAEYMTPKISFIVNDTTGYTYTKMDGVVEAPVELLTKDLVNA